MHPTLTGGLKIQVLTHEGQTYGRLYGTDTRPRVIMTAVCGGHEVVHTLSEKGWSDDHWHKAVYMERPGSPHDTRADVCLPTGYFLDIKGLVNVIKCEVI